jgi:hypothetical protein
VQPKGPIREARPFFIGGELGWNGLAGLGVNFSYHPIPYLALDTGAGLSLAGLRFGVRARANFLTGEWTPTAGVGITHALGTGGNEVELESKSEKVKLEILPSSYLQFVGGVNYTGTEGFVFSGLLGYAVLLKKNTRYRSGSMDAYEDVKPIYGGGVVVSLAFGYAF